MRIDASQVAEHIPFSAWEPVDNGPLTRLEELAQKSFNAEEGHRFRPSKAEGGNPSFSWVRIGRIISGGVAKLSPLREAQDLTIGGYLARNLTGKWGDTPEWHDKNGLFDTSTGLKNVKFVSDEALVYNLSSGKPAEYKRSTTVAEDLFPSGPPSIADVKQSDSRADCFLLSSLLAILATTDGPKKIERIMRDNGDGTVTVRLSNRDYQVSKARVMDSDGNDSYSNSKTWVRVIEKAVQAYLLETAPDRLPDASVDYLLKKDWLQRGDPISAYQAFSHLWGEREESGAISVEHLNLDASHNAECFAAIDASLAEGAAVTVSSHKSASSIWRGISFGHTYAILTQAKGGDGRNGYIIRDPYGNNVGDREKQKEGEIQLLSKRGASATFFVQKEAMAAHFGYFSILSDPETAKARSLTNGQGSSDGSSSRSENNSISADDIDDFMKIQ
jgi:hypothetical protein